MPDPTTIGGLLSAIGIAGMDRVMQHNVLAMSGKAVEAAATSQRSAGQTGTITLGNRQAVAFLPVNGRPRRNWPMPLSFPVCGRNARGRSIVVLAKQKYNIRGREWRSTRRTSSVFRLHPMKRVDIDGRHLRKGATDAILKFVEQEAAPSHWAHRRRRSHLEDRGTPLAVADGAKLPASSTSRTSVKGE